MATSPQAQAGSYCGIRWGSLEKYSEAGNGLATYNVRAGRHACFDRMVIDVSGPLPGVNASYGSGLPIRGGAQLRIGLHLESALLESTTRPYTPAHPAELVNVTGYRTFRQIALVLDVIGEVE